MYLGISFCCKIELTIRQVRRWLLTSFVCQFVVREMRAAFRLPLNLIHPRHSFFKYMHELFHCISAWRMPFVLDEIGLFHRIVVVLDSRQEGEDELDFTTDGLRNQRTRS